MSFFNFKMAFFGLATIFTVVRSLHAYDRIVDVDRAFDDNQNDFEYYWYYYDDNYLVGKDDRPQNTNPGTPTIISVPSTDSIRHAFGDLTDTKVIKKYSFTTGSDGTNRFATLPFTFGSTWKTSWGTALPYCGIGTQLAPEGKGRDLTGATSFTFKIKSRVHPLSVNFKVQTLDIEVYSNVPGSQLTGKEFGYFASQIPVTTTWSTVTVPIMDLAYPTWAKNFAFDQKNCTKLVWEVGKEVNQTTTTDTLDIDDVAIIAPTICKCGPSFSKQKFPLPTSGQFSTFDKTPVNQNALGYYWYAYNDAATGGISIIKEETAKLDPTTKRFEINFAKDSTGTDGVGHGAKIDYTLGKSFLQNGTDVQGFIGIGCNLYDSSESTYWNATADGAKSIYFHYNTIGDIKNATLEISDINDVGDAANPTRKDSRGPGIVMYQDLPYTDGLWVAVEIPFDSLIYHSGLAGSKNIPLDKTKLAKIQWKVQGQEGKGGILAIDNIYFPGATFSGSGVKRVFTQPPHISAFKAIYLNGKVNVCWNNVETLSKGEVSLFNTSGAVVASAPIAKTGINFSAKTLLAGMYFVKLNAVNAIGKTVAMQSAISIVK